MARNIFSLSFVLTPTKLTINETAFKLLSLLEVLGKQDDIFNRFKLSKLHFKSVDFDLEKNTFDDNVFHLSEEILKFNLSDIRQYEKVKNPTIDFSRDFGFLLLLEFQNKKTKFSLSCNISSSQFCSISIENFPLENNDYDFEWYLNIQKQANEFLKPKYSGVKIILSQFVEMYLPLKVVYPLGWITYFSKDSLIEMPNDIGFEVIEEADGQYIIATREDFTQSKEQFLEMKSKLVSGMEQLKHLCFAYSETTDYSI